MNLKKLDIENNDEFKNYYNFLNRVDHHGHINFSNKYTIFKYKLVSEIKKKNLKLFLIYDDKKIVNYIEIHHQANINRTILKTFNHEDIFNFNSIFEQIDSKNRIEIGVRDSENQDDADSQNFGEPQYVVRSPDHRKFGVSPIPDKVYNIHFYAYTIPTSLSAYSDAIVLPDQYSNVITAKARYYVWQFKESPQQASFALEAYKKGMRQMKSNLMNPAPTYITDDRIYF